MPNLYPAFVIIEPKVFIKLLNVDFDNFDLCVLYSKSKNTGYSNTFPFKALITDSASFFNSFNVRA